MTPEYFINRCPTLWHVGAHGSWASIERLGLRTAEQLVDLAGLHDDERTELLQRPRPDSVRLAVGEGEVVIRDQGPLLRRKDFEVILQEDMTTADWLHLLNRRVYLFAQMAHMIQLREKYLKLEGWVEVITIETARLVEVVGTQLELSAQNTGAIARTRERYKTWHTFQALRDFPSQRPQEVTVVDGLDDLSAVLRVDRLWLDTTAENGRREELLFAAPPRRAARAILRDRSALLP